MMILKAKVPYSVLEILKYLCATKCLKKYQWLQFYRLYVPILDETPYIVVAKCTVQTGPIKLILKKQQFNLILGHDQ